MTAFFKKYRRDVVYLVVILGLTGWQVYNPQKQRDTALIEALNFSIRMASENHRMQVLYDEITKEAFAYPEEYKRYENKANRAPQVKSGRRWFAKPDVQSSICRTGRRAILPSNGSPRFPA